MSLIKDGHHKRKMDQGHEEVIHKIHIANKIRADINIRKNIFIKSKETIYI